MWRLVERVNFIDEQNRGLSLILQAILRGREDSAHIRYVRFHAAQSFNPALGLIRDDLRQGSAERAIKN